MACGRTVAASGARGLPDLIAHGETGLLCTTNEDWREALAKPRPALARVARERVPTRNDERHGFEAALARLTARCS